MKFFQVVMGILTKQIQIGEFLMPFNTLEFLLKIFVPIVISFILYKIIKSALIKGIEKSKLQDEKKLTFQIWAKHILRAILAVSTILFIINLLGARIADYLTAMASVLTHPIVEGISIMTILLVLPIIYVSRLAGKFAEKFARSSIMPYLKINSGTSNMAETVFKNIVMALVVLFGLTLIGFNLSLLYGLFGIIGIGIGFGLQSTVANLFAGMILLGTRPVKVGDHIIVDGKEGELTEIRFVNSIISTIEHETIVIPNTKLIDNPVHNYSFDDRHIIIKNSVQVSYLTDLDFALEIMKNVGKECPFLLKSKEIRSRVVSFDDSGITLMSVCWIKNSYDKYEALSWINLEIWRAFKANGIEIPYPKLDVTMLN